MTRYATIDVGSNSIKLFVAEAVARGEWRVLADRTEITRLAEKLQETGLLADAAMDRTFEVLGRFVDEARSLGVERVAAVGTMALRTAGNADAFLARAEGECGVDLEVISGTEEARLSYLAVRRGLPRLPGELIVFDVGGGSSEFIFGRGDVVDQLVSLDLGAVRLTDQFLPDDPVPEEQVAALCEEIDRSLLRLPGPDPGRPAVFRLVGVGGTPTNLSAVKQGLAAWRPDLIRGSTLTAAEVADLLSRFARTPLVRRREIVGLEPKRADVIVAGTALVLRIMGRFSCDRLTVSDHGVRHGLWHDRFGA